MYIAFNLLVRKGFSLSGNSAYRFEAQKPFSMYKVSRKKKTKDEREDLVETRGILKQKSNV